MTTYTEEVLRQRAISTLANFGQAWVTADGNPFAKEETATSHARKLSDSTVVHFTATAEEIAKWEKEKKDAQAAKEKAAKEAEKPQTESK